MDVLKSIIEQGFSVGTQVDTIFTDNEDPFYGIVKLVNLINNKQTGEGLKFAVNFDDSTQSHLTFSIGFLQGNLLSQQLNKEWD
jgi:hypothetical protein